jgi:SAM-dependent methyltransferase
MEDNKVSHRTIAGFYNNDYYRDAGLHPASQYDYRDLLARLHLRADDRVLDIACGTGNWLAVAGQHSEHIFGIDISETALGVCRGRLPSAGICAGLGEKLPFADANFDVITCLGSLEHFLDQSQALQEICRVANDGARILILVPNAGFLTYRLGLYRGTNQSRLRETIRSISDWQDLFDQSGLTVTDRWADLHVLDRSWIMRGVWYRIPLRALQALILLIWPLQWQYQVNFLCRLKR